MSQHASHELLILDEARVDLVQQAKTLPFITLNHRQLYDLELLLNGAFHPLRGFMTRADYETVLSDMRLSDGSLWPMPITLDVDEPFVEQIQLGDEITLKDSQGFALATLQISDMWEIDKLLEAELIYGTTDVMHPGVEYLMQQVKSHYIGGQLRGIQLPMHYDFLQFRFTPSEMQKQFELRGWKNIIAFQTRNPMHRAHQELTFRAARETEANLLIHPVVGPTMPGDIDYPTRVRCYEALLPHYSEQTTLLGLLPLAMRMAGPREAVWHALIRKNYGCTHFIIGRDHASPSQRCGNFYESYAAQELAISLQDEMDINIVPFAEMVYDDDRAQYVTVNEVKPEDKVLRLSGTELRERLREEIEVPNWFSYPEVIKELQRTYPPKYQRGFCVLFTGLSGAGKSVLAHALQEKLQEIGGRTITPLDGDSVRRHLSTELGFTKRDRDLNILRIAYIASEIVKHRGIAICSVIAPYRQTRRRMRELIEHVGGFIEVHVSTPLDICEQRDRKGLYARARKGEIEYFTGISDPYESPKNADLVIDTSDLPPDEAVQQVLLKLEHLGYLLR